MHETVLTFGSCSIARSVVFTMVPDGCLALQESKTIAESHYGDAVPTTGRFDGSVRVDLDSAPQGSGEGSRIRI